MDLRFLLLLVCFFVSGFAALLYQTAWTREFAFLFGTSELAVVAVLAAYMAGLAAGAAVAARYVGRLTRPVLAYGVLELGIAIGALCVPLMVRGVQAVYIALAGGLDAPPETMALTTALFHLVGSFVVLVPCTALMGATLPLLARYAVSEDAQVGPRIGVLYSVNTFGAIAGTLVAAFYFLPAFGLRHTVYIGIAGNAVVFLAAALLARGLAGMPPEEPSREGARSPFHWILPAMTLSGIVSFVYEVLWTRLLGQVLGGSTVAFASMLSSFLLGIALGSALASRFAATRAAAARGFALAQLGCGLLGYVAFRSVERLPELAHAVGANPATPAPGAAAAGIVLLPVTLCIGATFPFGVRLLARDADEAAAVSGRVYAWNTVGSILGAILAGFFLLPGLGLENTALAGVLTSLVLAIGAALLAAPRRPLIAGIAGIAMLLALVVGVPRPDGLLLHSAISGGRSAGSLYYLGVGRSATVTVIENDTGWKLLTNGLPESGIDRPDLPDQRFNETAWLSLLPTAVRPDTEEMLIIGLGGARTLEATASTVRSIDVIELEEEVVVANKKIPRPTDPFADPRVSLRLGDARGAMQLTDKVYDAIVSQPSHPWTSGASHLYTREFFELVDSKLTDDGIFIQWIGVNFVDAPLLGSLCAAMADVFDHVEIYRPVAAALVFVASNGPIDIERSGRLALERAPVDFARFGIDRVEDFLASRTLDDAGVRAMAAGRPLNTDDHNRLATTRLPPAEATGHRKLLESRFAELEPVATADALADVEAAALLRRMALVGQGPRARRLTGLLPEASRHAARGWLAYDRQGRRAARELFARALAADPQDTAARSGLITVGVPETLEAAIDWSERERMAIAADQARRANGVQAVAAYDAALAAVPPSDLLFGWATRMRAAWRVESGDATRAREAIALMDRLLRRVRSTENYLLRVQAAAAAGDARIAWTGIQDLAMSRTTSPAAARQLLTIARSLPPNEDASPHLGRLRQIIARSDRRR